MEKFHSKNILEVIFKNHHYKYYDPKLPSIAF